MSNFNALYKHFIENNTSAGVLGQGSYAPNDNRPFEPARMAIGAKFTKKRNKKEPSQQMVKVPVQKRPKIENILIRPK